ncbi:MAG TPA: porin [Polyangiaceae bacterium]
MWHVLLCDLVLLASPAGATTAAGTTHSGGENTIPPWLRETSERVNVYGRFDGHLALSGDGVEMKNNGSRFGLTAEQDVWRGFVLFGRGEWALKLGDGDTSYNVTLNPDTELATADATTEGAFGTRLGFVGMRFREFGTLALGKQEGVYYDVSKWTDVYTVFGANGSSTYNAGTDGGQTGEGRANGAVSYRVLAGPIAIGAQAQFLDTREAVVDGVSGSLVVDVGAGLRAGIAYSRSFLDLNAAIAGYDGGDAQALTAGVHFGDAHWTLAVVDTWTRNHELVPTESATVMYDTLGAELYVARRFGNVAMPYAGFDFAIPRALDARFVDPDYGTRDLIAGARFFVDSRARSFAYVEGRTGATRDALGERADDVVMAGLRLDFSLRESLGFEP